MVSAYLWIYRPRTPDHCQPDCPIENTKCSAASEAERLYESVMLASCCGFFAMFVPISYVVVEAQEDGVNPNLAGYLLTILNAAR